MYQTAQATQQYKNLDLQAKTESASPHELIQMLLGAAIVRIKSAVTHMERNEIASKAELISKAIAIVDGLRTSLDMEKGGNIAANLDDLYFYITRQLTLANAENKPEKLNEACALLEKIISAWQAIGPNKHA